MIMIRRSVNVIVLIAAFSVGVVLAFSPGWFQRGGGAAMKKEVQHQQQPTFGINKVARTAEPFFLDRGREWSEATVGELRAELKQRGLTVSGKKAELIERLQLERVSRLEHVSVGDKSQALVEVVSDQDYDTRKVATGTMKVINTFLNSPIEKGVPAETLKGAVISAAAVTAVVTKSVVGASAASLGAFYVTISHNSAGNLLRSFGTAIWGAAHGFVTGLRQVDDKTHLSERVEKVINTGISNIIEQVTEKDEHSAAQKSRTPGFWGDILGNTDFVSQEQETEEQKPTAQEDKLAEEVVIKEAMPVLEKPVVLPSPKSYPPPEAILAKELAVEDSSSEEEAELVMEEDIVVDISIPYDAAAKLAYEASDKSMAYPAFKTKFETNAVANVIAKQPVDIRIPYDAAAKLAYDTSDKSIDYLAFKTMFEGNAVADVIAKQPEPVEEEDVVLVGDKSMDFLALKSKFDATVGSVLQKKPERTEEAAVVEDEPQLVAKEVIVELSEEPPLVAEEDLADAEDEDWEASIMAAQKSIDGAIAGWEEANVPEETVDEEEWDGDVLGDLDSDEPIDLEALGRAAREAVEAFERQMANDGEATLQQRQQWAENMLDDDDEQEESPAAVDWSIQPVSQLKAELESRGLSIEGKKAVLVARLTNRGNDMMEEAANEKPRSWIQMKVAELRLELQKRGLPSTGNKAKLVSALEMDVAVETPSPVLHNGDMEDAFPVLGVNDIDDGFLPTFDMDEFVNMGPAPAVDESKDTVPSTPDVKVSIPVFDSQYQDSEEDSDDDFDFDIDSFDMEELGRAARQAVDAYNGGYSPGADDDDEPSDEALMEILANGELTDDEPPSLESMTVPELKAELKSRGLPVTGKKAGLIARLEPIYSQGS
jgi:hypothetical protein